MKNQLHIIYSILILVLLNGCVTSSSKLADPSENFPPVILHQEAPQLHYNSIKDVAAVRSNEYIKAYPVGRHLDSNNPDIMHEAHIVYRREQPSRWNQQLHKPSYVPLGPTYAVIDPEKIKSPVSKALEDAFVTQTEIMKAIQAQNESILAKMKHMDEDIEVLKRAGLHHTDD